MQLVPANQGLDNALVGIYTKTHVQKVESYVLPVGMTIAFLQPSGMQLLAACAAIITALVSTIAVAHSPYQLLTLAEGGGGATPQHRACSF